MSQSEEDRRGLYDELAGAIGPDSAGVLMELLPRSPSSELVTRTDMQANTIMLRGEMAELRADLRTEMADLRAELTGEMAAQMGALRLDVARWLWTAWASNLAVMVALVLLVWRLGG